MGSISWPWIMEMLLRRIPTVKWGEYAVQAAQNLFSGLRTLYDAAGQPKPDNEIWGMIGITPMIGLNDVTTEIFYQQDAEDVLTFALQQDIRMLSFWSANRDQECPGGQVPTFRHHAAAYFRILWSSAPFCSPLPWFDSILRPFVQTNCFTVKPFELHCVYPDDEFEITGRRIQHPVTISKYRERSRHVPNTLCFFCVCYDSRLSLFRDDGFNTFKSRDPEWIRKWKTVDSMADEQKFQAAQDAVREMLDQARRQGNDLEWTRCLTRYTFLGITLHGYETAVRELLMAAWPENDVAQAILHLMSAHGLTSYYDAYRWEIDQREKVVGSDTVDPKVWTSEQIRDRADMHFRAAWAFRHVLGNLMVIDFRS